MSKFKKGDNVVRLGTNLNAQWKEAFNHSAHSPSSVCVVIEVDGSTIRVNDLDGVLVRCDGVERWGAEYFRLATDSEIHHGVALPAEYHITEKEEHVECLRNLLEVEKQRVASLLTLNNTLSEKLEAASDQRDAAVAAAKALGEDLRITRADRRLLRFYQAQVDGVATGLVDAVSDFTMSLSVLRTHLEQIGKMCDEQGNGADAKVMFDAASLCDVVVMATDALNELQEKQPDIYPEIELLD